MSIRRRSCDTCFKGRRKCDLAFPICGRCHRTQKSCHYAYPPQISAAHGSDSSDGASLTTMDLDPALVADLPLSMGPNASTSSSDAFTTTLVPASWSPPTAGFWWDQDPDMSLASVDQWLLSKWSVPKAMDILGDLEPVSYDSVDSPWVLNEYRHYPRLFAEEASNIFIHKELYSGALPQAIQAAFGICAASTRVNDRNKALLFRTLDAEFARLQNPPPGSRTPTILEDLASLQSVLLYQTIRIFHGDLPQRMAAEQQAALVEVAALRLLRRADLEIRSGAGQPWEAWVLAESIRRTVFIVLKLYVIYFHFRNDAYPSLATMLLLPLSVRPRFWDSRADFQLQRPDPHETVPFKEIKELWMASPEARLESYERMVLVRCANHKAACT